MIKLTTVLIAVTVAATMILLRPYASNDSFIQVENVPLMSNTENRPEDLIREYVRAARVMDVVGIEAQVTYMPASYWQYQTKKVMKEEGVAKNGTFKVDKNSFDSTDGPANTRQPLSLRAKNNYENTTQYYPEYINSRKLYVSRLLGQWTNETEGRIKVEFGSEIADALPNTDLWKFKFPIEKDFYLLKENGVWRIYMIMYTDVSETYPF